MPSFIPTPVFLGLIALACPLSSAETFSRADDTRARPPERWEKHDKDIWLDLKAQGSILAGNVTQFFLGGNLDSSVRLADGHRLYVEGSGNYTSFNEKPLIDKEKGSLLYAYGFRPNFNVFLHSTHARNRFLALRYRTTLQTGLCYHSFLQGALPLSLVSLGLAPEHDAYFDDTVNDDFRLASRLNLGAPITEGLAWDMDLIYMPLIRDLASYRIYAEMTFRFKVVAEILFFEVSLTDEFDTRPRPGVKTNDFSLMHSLVFHFDK